MTQELSEAEAVQVAAFGLDKPEPKIKSGVITMGYAYANKYESLLMASKKQQLAKVWPFPGSVVLELSLTDDELTPEQAIELAAHLVKAAEDSRHLHHYGDEAMLRDDRIAAKEARS